MKRRIFTIFIFIFLYSLYAERTYIEKSDGSGQWIEFIETWYEYDLDNNLIKEKYSNNDYVSYQYDNNQLIYKLHSSILGTFEEWYSNNILIHKKDSLGTEILYNSKGQEIYSKCFETEKWTDYDTSGNPYHIKFSNGEEQWSEYDSNNNIIYAVDYTKDGKNEYYYKYDSNNNKIFAKIQYSNEDPIEYWYEYNSNRKIIYEKRISGNDIKEIWHGYDKWGNESYYKDSYGIEWKRILDEFGNDISNDEYIYDYDDSGNVEYFKSLASDGYEVWYDYRGNDIHRRNADGYEYWIEYDENNNVIKFKNSKGIEILYEYNLNKVTHIRTNNFWYKINNGQLIYINDKNEYQAWYKYDINGNEIDFRDTNYNERKYNSDGKIIYKKESTISEFEKTEENILNIKGLKSLN